MKDMPSSSALSLLALPLITEAISSASSLLALPLIAEAISSTLSLLALPLIAEAISSLMQLVGFDFFFAGEPDESFEAVEVEVFEVGAAAKKDGILDCRRAFWIAFAMSAFDELERSLFHTQPSFASANMLPG
jgi:hypothetical protein